MTAGPTTATVRRLRRIAREARNTYVGTHWPSMQAMRRDGVGFWLVDNVKDEAKIRRFLDTFSPEMVADILAALTVLHDEGRAGQMTGHVLSR